MFGKKKAAVAAREHTPGEVRYDPKWAARKDGTLKPVKPQIPSPLTRQLRRQLERLRQKQPIYMSQSDWHDEQGFPKIIASHKRRGTKAQSHKRIIHTVVKMVKGILREIQLHATKGERSYRK